MKTFTALVNNICDFKYLYVSVFLCVCMCVCARACVRVCVCVFTS